MKHKRKDESREERVQYAALPYRWDGEALQVRLITSRETRRWVIPKGWPMKGREPWEAAEREAYEEAGLVGLVGQDPIGTYRYDKRRKSGIVPCRVEVFPLHVRAELDEWPERLEREGRWFNQEAAAEAVREPELKDLIRRLGDILAASRAAAERAHSEAVS